MARLAKTQPAAVDVRAHLVSRFERSRLRSSDQAQPDGGLFVNPAGRQLERLRRGDPVVVNSFQLPAELASRWWRHQRVVVAPDGSISAEVRT